MKRLALAVLFALVAFPAAAQNACTTQFGTCALAMPMNPGSPCVCFSHGGAIQGFVPIASGSLPSFCCTPAGRFGPFSNSHIGVGQFCQVPGPAGPIGGQACF